MTTSDPSRAANGQDPIDEVIAKFVEQTVARPLVNNTLRGFLVESIIALELEADWSWCGGDYGSWDFANDDGVRLEIKQSAARQSWKLGTGSKKSPPRFDIRVRQRAEDNGCSGRAAHIYIFAYHPVDNQTADHRDPKQWEFYCIPASKLPPQKSIGLRAIKNMAQPVKLGGLSLLLGTMARVLDDPMH